MHPAIDSGTPECSPNDARSGDGKNFEAFLRQQLDLKPPAADF
jgi:hypothetical protein